MPPQIISWIRAQNKYVVVATLVGVFLFCIVFAPMVVFSLISYKIYNSNLPNYISIPIIIILMTISCILEYFWFGFLKHKYYPNLPDFYDAIENK
jgi:hypothetical protein